MITMSNIILDILNNYKDFVYIDINLNSGRSFQVNEILEFNDEYIIVITGVRRVLITTLSISHIFIEGSEEEEKQLNLKTSKEDLNKMYLLYYS